MARKRNRHGRKPKLDSQADKMLDDVDIYILAYLDYTLNDASLRHTFRQNVVQHIKATHNLVLTLSQIVDRVRRVGRRFASFGIDDQDLEQQGTEHFKIPKQYRTAIQDLVVSIKENALSSVLRDQQRVLRSSALQTNKNDHRTPVHVSLSAHNRGRKLTPQRRQIASEDDTQSSLTTRLEYLHVDASSQVQPPANQRYVSHSLESSLTDYDSISEVDQPQSMHVLPQRQVSIPLQHSLASIGVLVGLESVAQKVADESLKNQLCAIRDCYMVETEFQRSTIRRLEKEVKDTLLQLRIEQSVVKTMSQDSHGSIESLAKDNRSHLSRIDELSEQRDQTRLLFVIAQQLQNFDQQPGFTFVKESFPTLMSDIQQVLATPDEQIFTQSHNLELDDHVCDLLKYTLGDQTRESLRVYCSDAIRVCSSAVRLVQTLLAVTMSRWVFETPIHEMDRNKGIVHDHYRQHLSKLDGSFLSNLDLCVYRDLVQSDEWLETYTKPKATILASTFLDLLSPLFTSNASDHNSERPHTALEWTEEKDYLEKIYGDALMLRAQSVVGTHVFRTIWFLKGTTFNSSTMTIEGDDCGELEQRFTQICVRLCVQPALVCFKGCKEVCDQTSFVSAAVPGKTDFDVLFKAVVLIDAADKSFVDDSEGDPMSF